MSHAFACHGEIDLVHLTIRVHKFCHDFVNGLDSAISFRSRWGQLHARCYLASMWIWGMYTT